MSLKGNRKAVRLAAGITTTFLAFFGVSAIASANPDDSTEVEVEVPVTEVPTPDYDNSDEEVVTTDVETTDEETSDGDGGYMPGETSYSTETIDPDIPDYEDPEGDWTGGDDGYDHTEYPTTTDCPETEITEYPDDEYDDEDNPCCEDEEDTDVDVDEGDEVIVDNNNENDNYNNNENTNIVVVPPGDNGGGGDDIGGVEVNVPVDITIDGSTVTVTKITETNVLNETTVRTPGGNLVVIRPDGKGGHTAAPAPVVKEPTPEESHTGHNPVTVANVSSNRPLEWSDEGLAGIAFIGGLAYYVSSRRKSVNDSASRS